MCRHAAFHDSSRRSAASDTLSERSLDDAFSRGFDKVNVCAEILAIGAGTGILRRTLTAGVFFSTEAESMGLRKSRSSRVFWKEIARRPAFGCADQGVVCERGGVNTAFQNTVRALPVGLKDAVFHAAAGRGDFLFVDLDQIVGERKVLRFGALDTHVDEDSR